MTKADLLQALTQRRKEGRGRNQIGNDWDAGFRAAEHLVTILLSASLDSEPEPVSVRLAADSAQARTLYDPNLTAAEACGPFNPAKALDAKRAK